MLSAREQQRYLRHTLLEEIGKEGQLRLKNSKVLVIGAGGLGCPVLQYLAAAGVGKIGILDDDLVDISNLQRQILYAERDVGDPKVFAAKKRLQEMNSNVEVSAYYERLQVNNAEKIFSQYDVIVECSDSFSTKYLASDAAVLTGKPLVFGSIFKFDGQVSVFNYQNGPTYRCLFPEPVAPEEMPTCSEIGVLGILPGLIGSLQANEVLKIILGIGEVLSGKLLLFDSLTLQQQIMPFSKNPEIKIKHLKEIDFSCTTGLTSLTYEDYRSNTGFYNLLDVRTPEERAAANIGGHHIPLSELKSRRNELDQKDNYLVYCASGVRSSKAVSELQEYFPKKRFYNLEGGILKLSKLQQD